MMRPTNAALEAFRLRDGAVARLNVRISAAYLLLSIANDYLTDADDELKESGLCIGEIRQAFNRVQKDFDAYHRLLFEMMTNSDNRRLFCEDFAELRSIIDKFCWAGFDEELIKHENI